MAARTMPHFLIQMTLVRATLHHNYSHLAQADIDID
jgi:hypothetical protein